MMFGPWGNRDHDDCVRIIHAALDAGINFIDTADVYSAASPRRSSARRSTGGARRRRARDEVPRRRWATTRTSAATRGAGSCKEVENSLRRLGTDYIDLYQIHRPDPTTDIDETLGALSDLVRQGKMRYLGSSTFPAEEIVEAQWIAERRNRERFVCEQPPYSIFVRGIERDVLPTCERYGMGVIAWSPLAGGWLTGKYRKGAGAPEGRPGRDAARSASTSTIPDNARKLDLVEELLEARGRRRLLAHPPGDGLRASRIRR